MRKSVALIGIIVFLAASCLMAVEAVSASSPGSWASKAPMQEARGGLGAAVVNGKIYALGGYSGSGSYLNTNEEYNPETDTWALRAPMPTPMAFFGVAVCQNKIYCISGENGANEVYDPATNTWETIASLPNPREGITANVVAGKIYVIGGEVNTTDVYDPATDSWTTAAPIPVSPRLNWGWSCASVVVDGKIHVIGAFPFSNSHQIYDPLTNGWNFGEPLIAGYWFAVAGTTTGVNSPKRLYVFSADRRWWDNGVINFSSQSYDPKTDSWTVCEPMPTGRLNAAVAVVDDRLYVIGGFVPWLGSNWDASAANELYVPFGHGTPAQSYDDVAPEITVASPENKTYHTSGVSLNFTVNEPAATMRYVLDGEAAVETAGNTTLAGLSYGSHNLAVYAVDAAGNTGASETVFFTVAKKPEPFPVMLVAAASGVAITVAVACVFYCRKKRSR